MKKNFIELAKRYHPDHGGDEDDMKALLRFKDEISDEELPKAMSIHLTDKVQKMLKDMRRLNVIYKCGAKYEALVYYKAKITVVDGLGLIHQDCDQCREKGINKKQTLHDRDLAKRLFKDPT